MDALLDAAVRAASARAEACHVRRVELAGRRAIEPVDAIRARAALDRAAERATLATVRLGRARSRYRDKTMGRRGVELRECDSSTLRADGCQLPLARLYPLYLSVGGRCTEFELDAYLHEVIELPEDERSVLGYAVWELTNFAG